VPTLLRSVIDTLGRLRGDIEGVAGGPQPAVPIRDSIGRDYLSCLVCGQRHKLLKRHLASAHGLTPEDYRAMFGLDSNYPMTAPAYSKKRARMARDIGLGRRTDGRNEAA
jgi:predicted transcriptional regulator